MSRVLVAGIGNVFFNDDGFGVEVARRLSRRELPPRTVVADYGIRGVHLAYELLATPSLLVLVDAVARGSAPGTLYVIDPELESGGPTAAPDGHAMDPRAVFSALRDLGGIMPRTRIVGCEPADIGEGMTLSAPVERAIEPAIGMIQQLISKEGAP